MEDNKLALMDAVVEITSGAVSNNNVTICAEGGEFVAEFMQALYSKLEPLFANQSE